MTSILPVVLYIMALAYLLVLDFEATCSNLARIEKQEIIEFPILVYDLAINAVTATFHKYVKPVVNPTLTEFCTELTGITQVRFDCNYALELEYK